MTETEQTRLAYLRSQNMQWLAVEPRAQNWDVTFLLFLVDGLIKELKWKG